MSVIPYVCETWTSNVIYKLISNRNLIFVKDVTFILDGQEIKSSKKKLQNTES